MNSERMQSSQVVNKMKELNREIERLKSSEKIKQTEIDMLKEKLDKTKKKLSDIENEQEEMIEKNHALKKEKASLENQLLFGSGNGAGEGGRGDFEKEKLREKIDELMAKIENKRQKLEWMRRENEFYNQIITVFLTIRKVIEKEKKYCYMLATEKDVLMKKQLMDGITMCGDKSQQLDDKLKKLLRTVKQQQNQTYWREKMMTTEFPVGEH